MTRLVAALSAPPPRQSGLPLIVPKPSADLARVVPLQPAKCPLGEIPTPLLPTRNYGIFHRLLSRAGLPLVFYDQAVTPGCTLCLRQVHFVCVLPLFGNCGWTVHCPAPLYFLSSAEASFQSFRSPLLFVPGFPMGAFCFFKGLSPPEGFSPFFLVLGRGVPLYLLLFFRRSHPGTPTFPTIFVEARRFLTSRILFFLLSLVGPFPLITP